MYYTIENEFLTAQINDFGAELHSLKNLIGILTQKI